MENQDEDQEELYWNPSHAYSYSVLFMLAVPGTLLASFGTACYWMTRQQRLDRDNSTDGM